jgi:hypothetical protein
LKGGKALISCELCVFFLSTSIVAPCDKCVGYSRYQRGYSESEIEEEYNNTEIEALGKDN